MPAPALRSSCSSFQWLWKLYYRCSLRSLIFFVGGFLTTVVLFTALYGNSYSNGGIFYGKLPNILKNFRPSSLMYWTRPKPLILLWTPYFTKTEDWIPSLQTLSCPVDCTITSNRSRLKDSAAVILHLRDVNLKDLPILMNTSQKWVLFNKEAPPHTPKHVIESLNGKIHWTATYRHDSDFSAPYGKVIARTSKTSKDVSDAGHFINKTYLVCWIVSHCSTPSQREQYAKALSRYIPVVIYGSCGYKTCPDAVANHCYQHIANKCKFYLSFENSICKDYVTEKLFYALRTNMVPIVMGGENYSQILPKHSYINVFDYSSPEDLANYLMELDRNPKKYEKYLEWKVNYEVIDMAYRWACGLCQKLYNEDSFSSQIAYENLSSWWYDKANCRQKTLVVN